MTSIKYIQLPNRVRLPYVEQGEPSGVPVLLLHGYADSWRSFELLLPHLPESIRAFALTQRGHGDAGRPQDGYRVNDFATDLHAYMDALHLETAVIVGGSSGGLVARRFAIDHPERALGLVLLGSPLTLQGKPKAQELWDSTLSNLTDPIDPSFAREFQRSTLVQPVPQPFLDSMVQESLRLPARVWKATFEGLLLDDSSRELKKIRASTLIVWGDRDDVVPRSDQEALAAAIPTSRLVVYPGAGHALYWEQPVRIASDIVAFVQGIIN